MVTSPCRSSSWLLKQPDNYRISKRQDLEELEMNGATPSPLLSPDEAVRGIRKGTAVRGFSPMDVRCAARHRLRFHSATNIISPLFPPPHLCRATHRLPRPHWRPHTGVTPRAQRESRHRGGHGTQVLFRSRDPRPRCKLSTRVGCHGRPASAIGTRMLRLKGSAQTNRI